MNDFFYKKKQDAYRDGRLFSGMNRHENQILFIYLAEDGYTIVTERRVGESPSALALNGRIYQEVSQ